MNMIEDYWIPQIPNRNTYKIDVSNISKDEAETLITKLKNKLKGTKDENQF